MMMMLVLLFSHNIAAVHVMFSWCIEIDCCLPTWRCSGCALGQPVRQASALACEWPCATPQRKKEKRIDC